LANASTRRIDVFVIGHDGNLAPDARFPGDSFDDDGAIVDFMDFFFEETLKESFGRTGDLNLRSPRGFAFFGHGRLDFLNVDLDRIADFEVFVADHFAAAQLDRGPADVDGDRTVIRFFNGAGHHLTDMILVDIIKGGPLSGC